MTLRGVLTTCGQGANANLKSWRQQREALCALTGHTVTRPRTQGPPSIDFSVLTCLVSLFPHSLSLPLSPHASPSLPLSRVVPRGSLTLFFCLASVSFSGSVSLVIAWIKTCFFLLAQSSVKRSSQFSAVFLFACPPLETLSAPS